MELNTKSLLFSAMINIILSANPEIEIQNELTNLYQTSSDHSEQNATSPPCSQKTQQKYISMSKENLRKFENKFHSENKKILILDIDSTLYKYTNEFGAHEYLAYLSAFDKLKKKGDTTRLEDFKNESDSIFLKAVYKYLDVSPIEFERALGEMNYDKHIKKDAKLSSYLSKCEYRIWCFTNGLKCRAEAILKAMKLEDFIEGIICVDDNVKNPIMKPEAKAYDFVERLLGLTASDTIYFFDDLEPNIKGARGDGMLIEFDLKMI